MPPGAAPAQAPAQATPQVPAYEDMLAQYLNGVFGPGNSFEPIQQQIIGQRDDALSRMAEQLASRGMGNSGLINAGASNIFSQTGKDLGGAYQNWRSGNLQDMRAALAPFIEQSLAEEMLGLTTEAKKELLNAQLEATMRQLFGYDYDPNLGTAEFEPFANLIAGAKPSGELVTAIESWMKNNPALAGYFPSPNEQEDSEFQAILDFMNEWSGKKK
jgi:hypothetical protein